MRSGWNVSDVIAFGALMISVISVIFSYGAIRIQRKLNTTNLQAIFYEEIFKKYLVEKIPEAIRRLDYRNGRLDNNYKQINMTLLQMMDECAYFAYANDEFYNELRRKCEELDEKLVKERGNNTSDREQQVKFIYSVHEDIKEIVKYINRNYSYCK